MTDEKFDILTKAKHNSDEAQELAKELAVVCNGYHSSIMGPAITLLSGVFIEQLETAHPGDGEKAKKLFLSGMETMMDLGIKKARITLSNNPLKH